MSKERHLGLGESITDWPNDAQPSLRAVAKGLCDLHGVDSLCGDAILCRLRGISRGEGGIAYCSSLMRAKAPSALQKKGGWI